MTPPVSIEPYSALPVRGSFLPTQRLHPWVPLHLKTSLDCLRCWFPGQLRLLSLQSARTSALEDFCLQSLSVPFSGEQALMMTPRPPDPLSYDARIQQRNYLRSPRSWGDADKHQRERGWLEHVGKDGCWPSAGGHQAGKQMAHNRTRVSQREETHGWPQNSMGEAMLTL